MSLRLSARFWCICLATCRFYICILCWLVFDILLLYGLLFQLFEEYTGCSWTIVPTVERLQDKWKCATFISKRVVFDDAYRRQASLKIINFIYCFSVLHRRKKRNHNKVIANISIDYVIESFNRGAVVKRCCIMRKGVPSISRSWRCIVTIYNTLRSPRASELEKPPAHAVFRCIVIS